ncbi:MAG: flagellar biosynthetic protein FliO [Polyangiales bacterium]
MKQPLFSRVFLLFHREKRGLASFSPPRDALDLYGIRTDTPGVWILLQASENAAELPAGYGAALLQGIISLGAVCILAWVLLRFGARRGLGTGGGQRIKVLERANLDARRSLYIVEVGEKCLLLGAGDTGGPELITELDASTLPPAPPQTSFRDVLQRIGARDSSAKASDNEAEDVAET